MLLSLSCSLLLFSISLQCYCTLLSPHTACRQLADGGRKGGGERSLNGRYTQPSRAADALCSHWKQANADRKCSLLTFSSLRISTSLTVFCVAPVTAATVSLVPGSPPAYFFLLLLLLLWLLLSLTCCWVAAPSFPFSLSSLPLSPSHLSSLFMSDVLCSQNQRKRPNSASEVLKIILHINVKNRFSVDKCHIDV